MQQKYDTIGKILFKTWYKEEFGTLAELARSCCIEYKTMNGWTRGCQKPTLEHAFLVEEISKGRVPARSWLNPVKGKQKMANNPKRNSEKKRHR